MYFWTEWVSIDLFLTICVLNLFLLLVTYFGGNKRHAWWFDMKRIQLCLFSFVPAKRCGYFWVYYWLHLCWLFYVFLFTMEVLCDMPFWMSWYFVKFIRHTDTFNYLLTLSSRTLAFIFSTLFSVRFLWHWQAWRIFRLSGASYLGDHFLYSHDLYISIKGDTVRKNGTEPVALRGDGVNVWPLGISDTNSSSHHRKSIYFGPNCLLRRMVWSALRI